jgi:hypothetical protein
MRVSSRNDVDRDETFATPKMVSAKPNNEVAGGGFTPVTYGATSNVAGMPYNSRQNVLSLLEGHPDLLMQGSLCLVGMGLERSVGALGAPGTAATRQLDMFDASQVLVALPARRR